jgi:glycosyltransferase involved in cell wall biosynthesis
MTAVPARVLWVSNETPDVAGQGGQRRQYFQIRELVAAGIQVELITLPGAQDDASIRALVGVRRVGRHTRSGLPDLRGRAAVSRAIRWGAFDVIVVAHLESWPFVERWAPTRTVRTGTRLLVDLHNVLSAWAGATGNLDRAAAYASTESLVLRTADAVSVCSPAEERRLPPGGTAERLVAMHGIEPAEWPEPGTPGGRPTVGAVGNWNWPPNAAGIEWFVHEVWRSVRERVPDAEFVVAGEGLAEPVASVAGVRYLGRVPDRMTVVAASDVMAVPVVSGVGAPVKFGEALVSGRAVIATADGASAHPGAPAFASDDPAEWVERLSSWLTDRDAAASAGRTARAFALERLTWAQTTRPLVDWIRGADQAGGPDSVR